jgi:hypothetical protein
MGIFPMCSPPRRVLVFAVAFPSAFASAVKIRLHARTGVEHMGKMPMLHEEAARAGKAAKGELA